MNLGIDKKGWIDGWMNDVVHEQMDGEKNEQSVGQIDGQRMNKKREWWVGLWINGGIVWLDS